jgi:peroxiredoxin
VLLTSCSPKHETIITGEIDYLGDVDFYLETIPLHYKYSERTQFPISVDGSLFEISLPIEVPQIVYLVIQDEKYPLYIEPNNPTSISIKRSTFPYEVNVVGPGQESNDNYQGFIEDIRGLDNSIKAEMDKFKVGENNEALVLSQQKVQLAKEHLAGTSFNDLYLKTVGEDFVIKLRAVEYSARHFPNYDANSARQSIIDEAISSDFFSYESLKAQRAGIRDFTHYYARTFGIYDDVNQRFGRTLAEYDIKRVAYDELNEKRMQVLDVITDPKGKAYADLFLVAERIGEIPLEIAEESYQNYITNYNQYPEFIEFITWFHDEIKSVSPGEPAIPFSLYNIDGEEFSIDDFAGKFVLLDFWAGWCQPCLEEFPIMRDIYSNYSRENLEIVGISTEVDSLVWTQDLRRFQNPWVQLYGGKGFEQETFKAYKGGGIPFYILVDPDGNIARYNDMRPSFNFTEVLDSLLLHQEIIKTSP